jgi:hypothetical protein
MANPASFLQHLKEQGYHPRSDKHSNSLAQAIVDDLVRHCPAIRNRAKRGELVYSLNCTLRAGTADWNVDLVLGPPPLESRVPKKSGPIARAVPSTVQIAIEIKAVMTEHRKAVKNRKRDLEAHHEHVHNYDNNAIAGGLLVVNAAETFQSPLRPEVTVHRDSAALVSHCIAELRAVSMRGGPKGYGLDAKCAVVVSVDNVNRSSAKFVTAAPAPAIGDPMHYDALIRTVCDQYTRRF